MTIPLGSPVVILRVFHVLVTQLWTYVLICFAKQSIDPILQTVMALYDKTVTACDCVHT